MNNIPEGYKQTEVGVIPQGWEVIKLGDIFDFKNGLNKEKEYFGHGTPIVNYLDVYKNKALAAKDLIGKVTVTKTELKAYEVCKDDVFFTRTSETVDEIGLTSVITEQLEKTVFSGFLLRARPKNNWLDTYYKKYCFSSKNVRKLITSNSSYTIRALTNGRLLSKVQIPLPPLPEQIAIASALTDVDALITAMEQLITKKRNIKQGAIQQLLTGKKRLLGFGGEWALLNIDEIADVKGGKRLPEGESLSDSPTQHPYIRVADMYQGSVSLKDIKYISDDIFQEIKNYTISKDDLFITVAGTLGIVGKVPPIIDGANLTENADKLTNIKCNQDFLLYLLISSNFQNFVETARTLGAQPKLALTRIEKYQILLPPLPEQTAIATILSDMDAEIEALEQKRDKYKALKQGMMQELLTGKTRLV